MARLFSGHERTWRDYRYVYPVVSRRSRGLSIGINLNVDGACNFDCVYCQVARPTGRPGEVDLDRLADELSTMVEAVVRGAIWSDPAFGATPIEMRRFNDIAFSGDGEPTAHPAFGEACRLAAEARERFGLTTTRLVLITNATRLDRPEVMRSLAMLDGNGGEVWAKLDAGTDAYFQAVDRPRGGITLDRVVANIAMAARRRPLVIQTMWLAMDGQGPGDGEFEAYLDRLAEVRAAGGTIDRVQFYTVARPPTEARVRPLSAQRLDAMAERLGRRFPDLDVATFPAK